MYPPRKALPIPNKIMSTLNQFYCPHCYTEHTVTINKDFRDYLIRCIDCENHFNFPYEALDSYPNSWDLLKNRLFG